MGSEESSRRLLDLLLVAACLTIVRGHGKGMELAMAEAKPRGKATDGCGRQADCSASRHSVGLPVTARVSGREVISLAPIPYGRLIGRTRCTLVNASNLPNG